GVATQWPEEVEIIFDERLYAATPQVVLSIVRAQNDAKRSLLVIGHNPGLQEMAELLIAAGDVELRERLREKFPTAALAVIDFAVKKWGRNHNRSSRLDRYVTPRSIAAATNQGQHDFQENPGAGRSRRHRPRQIRHRDRGVARERIWRLGPALERAIDHPGDACPIRAG